MRTNIGILAPAVLLGIASAAPALDNVSPHLNRLQARQAIYDKSCDRVNPHNNKEHMKDKAMRAFGDVATIVNTVNNDIKAKLPHGELAYKDSNAFKHYFADKDYDKVKHMMQVIYNDRLPADSLHSTSYKYTVKCGTDQSKEACAQSLAVTDLRADTPLIVLCDKFFDPKEEEVKNDLKSKDGSSGRRGWCQGNEKFPFFSVAGLTLFHEMTHLDLVGKAAGLSERQHKGYKSHGTVDIYDEGAKEDIEKYKRNKHLMKPYDASRQLKDYWDEHDKDSHKYKPKALTIENAESYAASALEWYFQVFCKWDNIEGEAPLHDNKVKNDPAWSNA